MAHEYSIEGLLDRIDNMLSLPCYNLSPETVVVLQDIYRYTEIHREFTDDQLTAVDGIEESHTCTWRCE